MKFSKSKLALLFCLPILSLSLGQAAKAERVCQVTDPTGSPLNVRSAPNGTVINSLRNGREVYVHDSAIDRQGRSWVKVGGYYQEQYQMWGWVFREFVSCYNR